MPCCRWAVPVAGAAAWGACPWPGGRWMWRTAGPQSTRTVPCMAPSLGWMRCVMPQRPAGRATAARRVMGTSCWPLPRPWERCWRAGRHGSGCWPRCSCGPWPRALAGTRAIRTWQQQQQQRYRPVQAWVAGMAVATPPAPPPHPRQWPRIARRRARRKGRTGLGGSRHRQQQSAWPWGATACCCRCCWTMARGRAGGCALCASPWQC
jgi:hypothetical protein